MRVFYGKQFIAATSAASLCVTGCVRVPDMDSPLDTLVSGPSEVLVIDLTRRVKCELYQALSDRLPDIYRDEHRKFIDKNGKPIPKGGLPQFDETSQNYWLSKWNTTVKLELQLNNQGGISPGVSFTQLLPNYYNFAGGASLLPVGPGLDAFGLGKPVSTYAPTAAAVSQNFTLGLGGGVTTQAVRTEDVQFTVSMAELVKEFDPNGDWASVKSHYADCLDRESSKLENTAFLRSNLGFTEWLHSALGPTRCFNDPVGIEEDCKNKEQFRFLRPGHHPPVGSAAQTTKSVPPAVKGVKVQFNEEQLAAETAKDRFDRESKDYKSAIKPLYDALPIIKYNYKQVINPTYAKREADQKLCPQVKFPANLNKDYFVELQTVQDAYRLAGENAKNANKLAEARDYNHASGEIKKATEEAESVYADINEAKDKGDQFSKYFKQCEALSAPKKKEVPLDPPIDNISQTVQFLVAMNVSATPNWNLVRFKSNAAPAFAELVHNNTQTLTAVIGPPGASKAGANQELINFQTLTNYLRPVPPAIP